jgi:hypothetical protein
MERFRLVIAHIALLLRRTPSPGAWPITPQSADMDGGELVFDSLFPRLDRNSRLLRSCLREHTHALPNLDLISADRSVVRREGHPGHGTCRCPNEGSLSFVRMLFAPFGIIGPHFFPARNIGSKQMEVKSLGDHTTSTGTRQLRDILPELVNFGSH